MMSIKKYAVNRVQPKGCADKSPEGQKPRRTEAPRFCQLGQKPRDTFKHNLNNLSDVSIIFFQSNKKKTNNRCHTFCMMPINKSRSRSDQPICLYICCEFTFTFRSRAPLLRQLQSMMPNTQPHNKIMQSCIQPNLKLKNKAYI